MSRAVSLKRTPGSLAERFWSIAKSVGPSGDDSTNPDPKAVVRHVLKILDALSAGEVGDGVSQSTVSFLALLRQQEAAGDLSYASPEQARGESLDERSLVFSVGVLLFEELTGRHPFGAVSGTRRFSRIQKGEMGSGVQYFPQVPSQLRNVLMKAMGPFPEERFASLKELREHLERFVKGQPDEPAPKRERGPLKGLPPSPADIMFGSVDDHMPTTVRRVPSPPQKAPARREQHLKTDEVPALSADDLKKKRLTPRMRAVLERLAWLSVGAGGALAVTLLLVPGPRSSVPEPAPAARVAVGSGAPERVPERPVVTQMAPPEVPAPSANAPSVNAPAPAAAAAPKAEPPAPAPAGDEPATFDLELASKNAAHAARQCFGDMERPVTFQAGLLFSKEDAMARRTFLSPDEPLTVEQKRCLKTALLYTSAGAAPERSVVAEFKFRLRPDPTQDVVKFAIPK